MNFGPESLPSSDDLEMNEGHEYREVADIEQMIQNEVADSQSVEELIEVVGKIEPFERNRETVTAEDIIDKIQKVPSILNIGSITRAFGIRKKMTELIGGKVAIEQAGYTDIEAKENPERAISDVQTFEDLKVVLRSIGKIEGSSQTYTPEELIARIEAIESGNADTEVITGTYGLRQKVGELYRQQLENKDK